MLLVNNLDLDGKPITESHMDKILERMLLIYTRVTTFHSS